MVPAILAVLLLAASVAAAQAPVAPTSVASETAEDPETVSSQTPEVPRDAGPRVEWKAHPAFRYGSWFRIAFTAKIQEDAHGSDVAPVDFTTYELHRTRLGVQGRLYSHLEFEIERELTERELDVGDLPKTPWKDAFVNVSSIKAAQVQAGRFKIPFGLDELTGVTHMDFVYRSLGADYLAPGRDAGAMVHGRFFNRGLNYWAGLFRQDGDNARSSKRDGADRTFAGRLTATPLRFTSIDAFDSLELGAAFTVSDLANEQTTPNGLRGRTVMTQDVFYEPVYVSGRRQRVGFDLDWPVGAFSTRAEYTRVTDTRDGQGLGNDTLSDARAQSWYVAGTWIVTGEDKRRPIDPRREFIRGGGIGAVEVVARLERLWFDSVGGQTSAFRNPRAQTILVSGDRVLTFGVNWYVNRFVRVQANAIREHVEDAERSPMAGGGVFWNRVVRFQFVL